MNDSLNQNSVLQSITAATPEKLCELMRSIKMPVQIIGFTASAEGHTCYFRCMQKIVIKNKIAQSDGKIDG